MDISEFVMNENEKPLDRLVSDGGFCSIFRKIAVVGDSLSSGEFETFNEDGTKCYTDLFEHSWGQYLARMCGSKCYNFSRGGMTAMEFCQSWGEQNNAFDESKKVDAYIFALALNDHFGRGMETGDLTDINPDGSSNHPENYAGYYGELVLRYKKISPKAKLFFLTVPKDYGYGERMNELIEVNAFIRSMAEYFGGYVIDLWNYAPEYDEKFHENFFMIGHLNPQGYLLTAKMVASYIDYIVRKNPKDFEMVGMDGRETENWHFEAR